MLTFRWETGFCKNPQGDTSHKEIREDQDDRMILFGSMLGQVSRSQGIPPKNQWQRRNL